MSQMSVEYIADSASWSIIQPNNPPTGRYGSSIALYGDFMFIFGGYDGKNRLNKTYMIDLYELSDRSQWKEIEGTQPEKRDCHSSIVYKDQMVIFGGGDSFNWYDDMHMFDFKTLTWSEVITEGPKPLGRAGHSATLYNDKMYIFGGWNGMLTLNDMYMFDLKTLTWSEVNTYCYRPAPRDSHSATLINDKILIIGGGHCKNRYDDLHEFDLKTHK